MKVSGGWNGKAQKKARRKKDAPGDDWRQASILSKFDTLLRNPQWRWVVMGSSAQGESARTATTHPDETAH
jgi:hypothetical protein